MNTSIGNLCVGRTFGLVSELGASCGIVWITFATDVSLCYVLFHMLAEGKAVQPKSGKTLMILLTYF